MLCYGVIVVAGCSVVHLISSTLRRLLFQYNHPLRNLHRKRVAYCRAQECGHQRTLTVNVLAFVVWEVAASWRKQPCVSIFQAEKILITFHINCILRRQWPHNLYSWHCTRYTDLLWEQRSFFVHRVRVISASQLAVLAVYIDSLVSLWMHLASNSITSIQLSAAT
jgi:hypothetical protein